MQTLFDHSQNKMKAGFGERMSDVQPIRHIALHKSYRNGQHSTSPSEVHSYSKPHTAQPALISDTRLFHHSLGE